MLRVTLHKGYYDGDKEIDERIYKTKGGALKRIMDLTPLMKQNDLLEVRPAQRPMYGSDYGIKANLPTTLGFGKDGWAEMIDRMLKYGCD